MSSMTFLTALAAGILSFLSPCILPLVPVYLANIAGASALTPDLTDRRRIVFHTISFIVDFSLVLIALGASLGLLGAMAPFQLLYKVALTPTHSNSKLTNWKGFQVFGRNSPVAVQLI